MKKVVISPLKVVISKSIMTHLKAVISTLKAVISTPEGGDQHSEGGDKQKKNLSPRAPVGAKNLIFMRQPVDKIVLQWAMFSVCQKCWIKF